MGGNRNGGGAVTAQGWCIYFIAWLEGGILMVRAELWLAVLVWAGGMAGAQAMTGKAVEARRREIRKALFVPEPLPAVKAEGYGSFTPMAGVVAERISYGTEFGLRVPAIVYRPEKEPRGRMPAIVVVNGHGGDKSSWYAWYTGMLYAQAGAVVLTYDMIGSGERSDEHTPVASEHDRPIDVATMPSRMGGLMITDAMQAVSYLSGRKDVDAKRIAVMGFSMGAFVTVLTGAVDARIHALLLVGGGDIDGPGGYFDQNHLIMCQSGPWKALSFLGDRPAVIYTLNARRGPTYIINGTADTVVDIPGHGPAFFEDLARRVAVLNGGTKNVFTTYFDPGASHRPSWMTPVAATWLDAQLGFSQWPRGSIAGMPTVRIGEWAEKAGYPSTKNFAREDRDAGIVALAAGIPALTVAQTDVMPREAWEKRKAEFIYSSWVKEALERAEHPAPRLGGTE